MANVKLLANERDPDDNDSNLVEFWLKKDPVRWISGALAGVVAAWIAFGFASLMAAASGNEPWFAIKFMATPLFGAEATELGMHVGHIVGGLAFLSVIGGIVGLAFGHFVFTNSIPALLAMGLVWAAFSWIFISNLFFQSIRALHFMNVSPAVTFPVCVVYGISLACVAFFDRMLRR